MIYKKDANFPYPLLTNVSTSYEESMFHLNVDLSENTENYIFTIEYQIDSEFIQTLLREEKAILYLVIQTKDNKFLKLDNDQKNIEISKTRISLNKRRTTIQLLIRANQDISFSRNNDLSDFYKNYKDSIIIPKHAIMGFSNTVLFDGSHTKPYDLFEKKIDPNMNCPIKVELGSETIIISYKNEEFQFIDSSQSNTLNNVYVYMGLQKALYRFIINNGDDNESVYIDEIDYPDDQLDCKLYNLMKAKKVPQVTIHNIDEVITMISDHIIKKYTDAVRRLYK